MKQSRYIIGLTGDISAGKSTVSKYLKKKGFTIIDCDEQANLLTENRDIASKLNLALEIKDNIDYYDRDRVRSIVFNDSQKKGKIQEILWPIVEKKVLDIISESSGVIVIDAPLLFEANLDRYCDEVWFVVIDRDIQKKRLMLRNNISEKEAELRISNFKDNKSKLEKSTHILYNNSTVEDLHRNIDILISNIVAN